MSVVVAVDGYIGQCVLFRPIFHSCNHGLTCIRAVQRVLTALCLSLRRSGGLPKAHASTLSMELLRQGNGLGVCVCACVCIDLLGMVLD